MALAVILSWSIVFLWTGRCYCVTSFLQSAEMDCAYRAKGWSRQRVCPSNAIGICTDGTCQSCEDCQLRHPAVLPAVANFTCVNSTTLKVRWQPCPVKKCSYCLGCNTSALVQLPLNPSEGILMCSGCDGTSTILWNFGTTYTGMLGTCNVTLDCKRMQGPQYINNGEQTYQTYPVKELWYSPVLRDYSCDVYDDPIVDSIIPTGGPMAGGTIITIVGTGLTNIEKFLIGESSCDFSEFRLNNTSTISKCRTPASDAEGWLSTSLVTATLPVKQRKLCQDLEFEYRPNPQVDRIEKAVTIAKGGIKVSFTGVNLGSADQPVMTVTAVCRATEQILENYAVACTATQNQTRLLCTTPDISGVRRYICLPQTNSNYSRFTPYNKYSDYDFYMGLLFDSFRRYEWLSSSMADHEGSWSKDKGLLKVYEDIMIIGFGSRTFDPNHDRILIIDGENMDMGAEISDYEVSMGSDSQCIVHSLLRNQLTCQPPVQEPTVDINNYKYINGKKAVHVVVRVGYLKVSAGYVAYISTEPPWLLILLATLIPTIVIAVIVATVVACRRRKLRRQQAAQATGTARSVRHSFNIYQYVSKTQRSTTGTEEDSSTVPLDSSTVPLLPPSLCNELAPFAVPRKSVQLGDVLGQGQFGKIYRAVLNLTTPAAAKCLRDESSNIEMAVRFIQEAAIMKDFQHNNVLRLLGVVLDNRNPIVLVPIMSGGDLRSAVKQQKFLLGDLVNFCQQVAAGMAYLSSHKFVHRDLAARNCLLDENYTVKISDFGLSHELDTKDYYRCQDQAKPLPVKWMAIESLLGGVFTTHSDVWSYGVTMWEITSHGCVPYADVNNYDMKRYLQGGRRLESPTGVPEELYSIMRKCWNSVPSRRPSFADLLSLIATFVTTYRVPHMERHFTKDVSSEPYSYAVVRESCCEQPAGHSHNPSYMQVLP